MNQHYILCGLGTVGLRVLEHLRAAGAQVTVVNNCPHEQHPLLAGVPMSTHLYPEIAAHLMRVTETAHWLEWQDWAYPILAEPFRLQDGCLVVPDKPGVGIEWDEKNVGRFAL